MLEFPAGFDRESLIALGTGISAILIAIGAAWQGLRRGRPTSATVAETAAHCLAVELIPAVKDIRDEMVELTARQKKQADELARQVELLIRLEERTRRSGRD